MTAKVLETGGTIHLKYTFYEGANTTGTNLGSIYVDVTGFTFYVYTVTYDAADGALSDAAASANGDKAGETYTIPADATATKDNATFIGWKTTLRGSETVYQPDQTIENINSNITLTAQYEQNYDVTFRGGLTGVVGLPEAPVKSHGATLDVSDYEPTLNGYTFAGWQVTSGSATVKGNEVSGIQGNITLTALWTKGGTTPAGSHKVKFVRNNATDGSALNWPDNQTGAANSTVTIPWNIPQAEGYTFLGWSTTENATTADADYAPGKEVPLGDEDITLYAVWRENMVSITYPASLAGGKVTLGATSVKPGASVTFSVLIAAGYDANSVNVTANGIGLGAVNKTTAQNGVTTLTYTFNPTVDTTILVSAPKKLTYNVTLPISDKVEVSFTAPEAAVGNKSTEVDYNSSVTFTVAARTGYTVKGVYANGQKLTGENGAYTIDHITADQTVTVDVEAIQFHKVTYVVLDKTYLVQDVQNGQSSTVENPVVEGYTFDGWYTSQTGNTKADLTSITADTIVYAHLTANTYTITYDANGGDFETSAATEQTKTHGQALSLNGPIPTREGCTFLGWSTVETATSASYVNGDQYSNEGNITLYAVWQPNTYTVTLPSGTGYSIETSQSTTVAHGDNFTFTVKVDRAYAANQPVVKVNSATDALTPGTTTQNDDGSMSYTYTILNITENKVVSVQVKQNLVYTVTFMTNDSIYQTQEVGYGEKATRPVDPTVEGYTFGGWYQNVDCTTEWHFVDVPASEGVAAVTANTVTDNTTIYAKLTPITPAITWTAPSTTDGYTIEVKGTKSGATTESVLTSGDKVAYGSKVTFTITVADGYDATGMQVGVNGILYAPSAQNGSVYTFEFTAKENTTITVVGIERKTITITYSANARDDVSGMPTAEKVKYYIEGATDNSTITTQTPSRTGYEFVGWCTDSEATVTVNGNAKTIYSKNGGIVVYPGSTAPFITDTTLYAIWKAQETKLTLSITDVALKATDTRVIQYEGESITLQAALNVSAKGTVVFYKGDSEGNNGTRIGSAAINGKTAELSVKVGEYKTTDKDEYYWAVFESETDEGYADSKQSNIMNVGVFSKALSWKITEGTSKVADDGNVLNIYEGNGTTTATTEMIAGHTYTLEVKTGSITGVETLNTKQPVLGKDYKIVWQYTEVGKNDWKTDGEASDKATYLVTGDKSGYQFRAQIVPLGPDNGSLFVKAGKFTDDTLVSDQYDTCLYTKSTNTTVKQATTTALTVTGAENESKNVWVNGATDKFGRDHLAQFEGQTVTLTANITDTTTKNAVTDGGKVYFYRYVDGKNDTKLNETAVVVNNGVAELTNVKISKYNPENGVTSNLDKFYAVYEANETYETSASVAKEGDTYKSPADPLKDMVFIKSATLQTPVIMSEKPGMLAGHTANETTYLSPLTDLLAGISHTFKLKATAGSEDATANYSVVALDGRTVDAANYSIKWLKTTGSNEQEVDATGTNQINVDENKAGDCYRVKLTGKGVFADSSATSKDAVIGTKQDVTVTVEAIDAITKTPVDRENRKYPDVYQLNEIELTATVKAAETGATMQPTGTVTFYYKDGDNWVKLDSITLADATDGSGSKIASIKTDKLPVTDTTNTKRDVEITAVYEGNDTFNASATVNETEKSITAAAGCTTTNDTVTVYSSVVFNCGDENKNKTTVGDKGIHISVSDGVLKANEKATLALSDIYTLDRGLTGDLLDTIAKLNPNTDYTIQWQKLNGATAITGNDYSGSANWTPIGNATGTTLVLDKVEQDTAYRAVITVKEQPITKGSCKDVEQAIKGRQVYYSNVLMPTDTSMTVSVAINTGKTGSGFEGITEGETVTANVFLSGVVGTVPNANVTATITNDSAKGNTTDYKQTFTSKNTVNGWNAFDWDTTGVAPGFYTLTVSATTNTGYAAKEITRSLIVRESSYNIEVGNLNPTYNGRTQGLTVKLNGFDFHGTAINEAANKSWTVKYYDKDNNLVEPTQAGTYKAVVTLPASAYWTEKSIETTFTIAPRTVSIADAIAQAKVYDSTTDVNIVEVMLNDAETDQAANGTGLPTGNVGIINGDSIYAVATKAALEKANAGSNSFTISEIKLHGDDAANYVWDEKSYSESIYVSRSQVYGNASADVTLKAGEKLPADAVYMIDQAGNKITAYDVLYYLHTDTEIKKVDNTNEKGLYTVIARPKQDNYKSGVTLKVTVGDATSYTAAVEPQPSTLISISNTAELYGDVKGVNVELSNKDATYTVKYLNGTAEVTDPTTLNAGRYIVKVTASTGDVAYGIYTITKAHPSIDFETATDLTYNSMPQDGYTGTPNVGTESAESYFTYAGDVAIGYNTPAEGNVDEQAPVDAGTYAVTLHVNETANYTAHEVSKSFTIAKKDLTIKADSWQTTQYDAFPDMTAGYTGLAAEDGDATPDTSLRDVQIAPEFLYNPTNGKSDYSNNTLDQVGKVTIKPIDALSKNYAIFYENGEYTKQRDDANVDLAIHGLPQSSTGKNTVYYGDEIQLYPYGYYTTHANGSGIFNWSVSGAAATIDADKGILKVTGVGNFTITLKRGVGEQQISTSVEVTALKKEVKVHVADQDKVYSGSEQTYNGEVKAYDELYTTVNAATTTPANKERTNIGTQITTSRIATGSEKYQSEVYGGKFTINDKEATVAPVADEHIYGTNRTAPSTAYTSTDGNAISNVLTASQADDYNRLDVYDGYEIFVAGTENMNYNVKYTTDETAEDSAVKTYGDMKLYSTTTKAKNELNDATVYGEQANTLDWILEAVKSTTRNSATYSDNLADFTLPGTFIQQDKDDCVGNKVTYKAANREEGNTSSTALAADRTATDTAKDDNYELIFGSIANAKAENYTLTNADVKNAQGTMTSPTGTKGFIGAATTSDNLIEGSANIAQRPIKLEQAVSDAQLYWKLPQSQLYTALVNVLKAEENGDGRGLAKGHTIEDLDLSFTIQIGGQTYNVAKNGTDALGFTSAGTAAVTATVGDTNYKLENGPFTFDIVLKNIQIEATYTTKTFTGFTVLIKVHNEDGTTSPLNDAKGLSYKIFKKTGDSIDKTTAYASGTLTYQNRTAYDDKGGLCGVFTATYPQLPLLNSGETYFIQMYEYGVELKTNS